MLADYAAIATVGVNDLVRSQHFYEKQLGLQLIDANSEVLTFQTGKAIMFVYKSPHAGTNRATSVTWPVPNVDQSVAALKEKKVVFENYGDMPSMTHDGDVYRGPHGMTVCWFKDPDGNIHSLVTR
jgi:catechol 2,3-dioxygenase-like lactoylglutathione lyase family enzyme